MVYIDFICITVEIDWILNSFRECTYLRKRGSKRRKKQETTIFHGDDNINMVYNSFIFDD